MATETPTMAPAGWGDPARRTGLPPHALSWLHAEVGTGSPSTPVPATVPASGLDADLRAALSAVAVVRDDDDARLRCAAGRSYLDLLRLRRGEVSPPDAVVLPADAAEVAAVLRVCSDRGIAVVPFGGGTSVVGGVRPLSGPHGAVVALDLSRMDRLLSVDPVSLTAVFQPGVRGPEAERLLRPHGLTLGHFPQSYELATLGGYAATRSAGQASTGYGRFDDLVLGLRAQTPAGELVLGRGAASAAGPDLRELLVGSEGTLGVLTELTLRVRPLPDVRRYDGLVFRTWKDGTAALRALEQQGLAPDVARLSDPDETRVQLALSQHGLKGAALKTYLAGRGAARGCLAVLGWEGTARSTSPAPGRGEAAAGPRPAAARCRRRLGARALLAGPTCATTCSTPASSSRPSRRRRPGRSSTPSAGRSGRRCGPRCSAPRRSSCATCPTCTRRARRSTSRSSPARTPPTPRDSGSGPRRRRTGRWSTPGRPSPTTTPSAPTTPRT